MTQHYFPLSYYLQFQERGDTLLGYATPYQESEHKEATSFAQSQASVESWGSGTGFVLENTGVTGFEIGDVISRYRTSNKVWRISDPRGFDLEVPSANLELILRHSLIDCGVIQAACRWARGSDGQNWLLVEGTEAYAAAELYTQTRLSKVSLRDIKPGDRVRLKDNREVIYLGGHYELELEARHSLILSALKRRHYVQVLSDPKKSDNTSFDLDSRASLKVSSLIEESDEALTWEDVRTLIDDDGGLRLYYKPNMFLKAKMAPEDAQLTLEPTTVPFPEDVESYGRWRGWMEGGRFFVVKTPKGEWLLVSYHGHDPELYTLDMTIDPEATYSELPFKHVANPRPRSHYHSYYSGYQSSVPYLRPKIRELWEAQESFEGYTWYTLRLTGSKGESLLF